MTRTHHKSEGLGLHCYKWYKKWTTVFKSPKSIVLKHSMVKRQGYKACFMLNSIERKIRPAHIFNI